MTQTQLTADITQHLFTNSTPRLLYQLEIKWVWLPDIHNTSAVPWSIDLMVWYCASLQVSLNIWREKAKNKNKINGWKNYSPLTTIAEEALELKMLKTDHKKRKICRCSKTKSGETAAARKLLFCSKTCSRISFCKDSGMKSTFFRAL